MPLPRSCARLCKYLGFSVGQVAIQPSNVFLWLGYIDLAAVPACLPGLVLTQFHLLPV